MPVFCSSAHLSKSLSLPSSLWNLATNDFVFPYLVQSIESSCFQKLNYFQISAIQFCLAVKPIAGALTSSYCIPPASPNLSSPPLNISVHISNVPFCKSSNFSGHVSGQAITIFEFFKLYFCSIMLYMHIFFVVETADRWTSGVLIEKNEGTSWSKDDFVSTQNPAKIHGLFSTKNWLIPTI